MDTPNRRSWRTSSYKDNGGTCVEVAPAKNVVLVRDTKDHGTGPVLSFTYAEWAAFLDAPVVAVVDLVTRHDGVDIPTLWHLRDTLHFTDAEWDALLAGVHDGEFDFTGRPSLAAH